jgi:hypothetical protein
MEDDGASPRRGRRLLTALAVAAAVAAVPVGAALAGGSGGTSGSEASAGPGTTSIQSTAPDRGDGQRDGDRGERQRDGHRGGDRKDCPKDRQGDGSEQSSTTQL